MHLTLEEFETKFFEPERVKAYLENRPAWVEEYKKSDENSRWTTYFMLLGTLSSHGRISAREYQELGPILYQKGICPTPERLYTMTALIDLLKEEPAKKA